MSPTSFKLIKDGKKQSSQSKLKIANGKGAKSKGDAEKQKMDQQARDEAKGKHDNWFCWVRLNHFLDYNGENPASPMTNQNTGDHETFMPIADNNKGFKSLDNKLRNTNSSLSKVIYYLQTGVQASPLTKPYNITVKFKACFEKDPTDELEEAMLINYNKFD